MFMVMGAMKFYRIIDSAKNANSIEKQAQTESITNTGVEKIGNTGRYHRETFLEGSGHDIA